MDGLFETDDAATPLTEEEKQELIPVWITLRSELNELERKGILNAEKKLFARRQKDILTENFVRSVHKKMFENVWKWAGKFRTTEKNIGVAPYKISMELKNLLDDATYWVQNMTYSPDEIAVRFHHRLVWIHPFPNGNGRHSRLMTDLLLREMGQERFSWGRGSLVEPCELRTKYIEALRSADNGNIAPLLDFVRLIS